VISTSHFNAVCQELAGFAEWETVVRILKLLGQESLLLKYYLGIVTQARNKFWKECQWADPDESIVYCVFH
jgi:hypothetical protein